jgi:hypothetical protein
VTQSTRASLPPQQLAAAALALLAGDGRREAAATGFVWRLAVESKSGLAVDIACTGPDLPAAVEPAIASGALIAKERPWVGTYRLVVRVAGSIVLDLYWKRGEPTRIMGFARGDWEFDLVVGSSEGVKV